MWRWSGPTGTSSVTHARFASSMWASTTSPAWWGAVPHNTVTDHVPLLSVRAETRPSPPAQMSQRTAPNVLLASVVGEAVATKFVVAPSAAAQTSASLPVAVTVVIGTTVSDDGSLSAVVDVIADVVDGPADEDD